MKGNSILNKAKYTNNTDKWYAGYKIAEKENLKHPNKQWYIE